MQPERDGTLCLGRLRFLHISFLLTQRSVKVERTIDSLDMTDNVTFQSFKFAGAEVHLEVHQLNATTRFHSNQGNKTYDCVPHSVMIRAQLAQGFLLSPPGACAQTLADERGFRAVLGPNIDTP